VEDTYDLILRADHPLAERRKLSLKDVADEPWISSTLANGCRRITEEVCRQAGFEPRVAFEADDTMASQALVAAGVGVTLMPRLALTSVHPGVVARALTDRPRRNVWAARHESAYRSPACEAMLQIMIDVAAEFAETRLELAAS
jgi:DNA-binding transcriptional LysR family regulator